MCCTAVDGVPRTYAGGRRNSMVRVGSCGMAHQRRLLRGSENVAQLIEFDREDPGAMRSDRYFFSRRSGGVRHDRMPNGAVHSSRVERRRGSAASTR